MEDLDNSVLIEMVETIADNKFIMGDHLIEIGIGGPNLEATLSAVAIAQSELGHARLLYNWVNELKNEGRRGKRIDIKEQTGKAFSTAVKADDWISLLTSLYVTDVTADIVLNTISKSAYSEKMPSVKKMLQEQREHIIYARSWCNQLANDKGRIPIKLQDDLSKSSKEANEWLNSLQNDDRLRELKVLDDTTNFPALFNKEIESVIIKEVVTHAR